MKSPACIARDEDWLAERQGALLRSASEGVELSPVGEGAALVVSTR